MLREPRSPPDKGSGSPKEPLNEQDDLRKYAIASSGEAVSLRSGEEQVREAEKKPNQEAAYRPFFT